MCLSVSHQKHNLHQVCGCALIYRFFPHLPADRTEDEGGVLASSSPPKLHIDPFIGDILTRYVSVNNL